jgi:RecA-family ATPase
MTDFEFIDLFQTCKDAPPVLHFVLPGFLRGTVGSLVSSGGLGKTMLALQIAIQKTSMCRWFDFIDSKLEKVVYISAEDKENILRHRIHNICKNMSENHLKSLCENLKVVSPLIGQSPNIIDKKWMEKLKKTIEGASLLVIDTLRRFHVLDENSSSEMTSLIACLERVAEETNCSILFVHHVNKSLAANTDNQQSSRGSTVLVDNIRWCGFLSCLGQKEIDGLCIAENEKRFFVKFGISKNNYGEPFREIVLKRTEGGILEQIKWHQRDEQKREEQGEGKGRKNTHKNSNAGRKNAF